MHSSDNHVQRDKSQSTEGLFKCRFCDKVRFKMRFSYRFYLKLVIYSVMVNQDFLHKCNRAVHEKTHTREPASLQCRHCGKVKARFN